MSEVLANSSLLRLEECSIPPTPWFSICPSGRVIMALAPEFAPEHVANIKALGAETLLRRLWLIARSQDNYVVQWGDPAEDPADRKPVKKARSSLATGVRPGPE